MDNDKKEILKDESPRRGIPLDAQESTNREGKGRIDLMRKAGFIPGIEGKDPRITSDRKPKRYRQR